MVVSEGGQHPADASAEPSDRLAISTPDELLRALATDSRFQGFAARADGEGYVDVALGDGGGVTVVWPILWTDQTRLQPHLVRARSGYSPLVLLGSDADFATRAAEELLDHADLTAQTLPLGAQRLRFLFRHYQALLRIRREAAEGDLLSERYRFQLDELNAIGRALASTHDIEKLLPLILRKARDVTGADAGSVYVVEGDEKDDIALRQLRFKVSQNDSVQLDFTEVTLPISGTSIVGRCALTRELINIPDIYRLDPPGTGNNPWGFKHNRHFDERIGYRTQSVLAVPMIDAADQVIGVIQLINKKRRSDVTLRRAEDFETWVVPFDPRSCDIAATFASQAAISLENTQLYDDIRVLFEGFVRASVLAIESRDPTTSGHSQRVAELTVGLAHATDRESNGPYEGFKLNGDDLCQIEYAALLHDFGKVSVSERVLVKAKKLHEADRDLILARFDFIRKSLLAESAEAKLRMALGTPPGLLELKLAAADADCTARIDEIDEIVAFILKANQPTVLDQGGFERLADIAQRTYLDIHGAEQPYLRPHEVETLQILRGSLTPEERLEIESHVTHTYNFLKRIPWGRALRAIPDIAGAHHEKLDGTGYPHGRKADAIPVAARMMAIADIFDALTAADRPYKAAVPLAKALDIIASDVKHGKLDPDLFRIFVEGKIYERVLRPS